MPSETTIFVNSKLFQIMSNINNRPPNNKSGLFHGARHNDPATGMAMGGIQTIVDGSQVVEIEGEEYFLCRESMESSVVYNFQNKTNKQVLDKLFREEGCVFEQGKARSGDFISCRLVVLDDKPRNRKGTVKQIVNEMQKEKACRMSNDYSKRKLGGVFKETTPEELEARWGKKRESIEKLANNIQRLRYNISSDLKSDNPKIVLTALAVSLMDKTFERVGNEVSAKAGHVGISGLKKSQVAVIGNKIHLEYVGKSGVEHTKSFSDERIAKHLKKAIKNSPSKRVFTTSDGFQIKADRINRYLSDFDITAKDIRGFGANNQMVSKLEKQEIPEKESDRKKLYLKTLRSVAEKVGHGFATLRKHYVIPQLERAFVIDGKVIDISDRSTYEDGGDINCGCKHEEKTKKIKSEVKSAEPRGFAIFRNQKKSIQQDSGKEKLKDGGKIESTRINAPSVVYYGTDLSGLMFAEKSGGFNVMSFKSKIPDTSMHKIVLIAPYPSHLGADRKIKLNEFIGAVIPQELSIAKEILDNNGVKNIRTYGQSVSLKSGGEFSDSSKVMSASSRFRPYETIAFDPPLIGKNGNKLVSYSWAWTPTSATSREGDEVMKRISDWSQAQISADTGRDIVHQYTIETVDDGSKTVSSESVPILLGYTNRAELKNFPNLATASKTLARQKMQLAIMEEQEKEYRELQARFESAKKPEIVEIDEPVNFIGAQDDWKEGKHKVFQMGDVWVRQNNEHGSTYKSYIPIEKPKTSTIEMLESDWVQKRIKENGGKYPDGIYDLRQRVKRQERKVSEILKNTTS